MGTTIQITAADGHTLDAYLADPGVPPRAGIVVIQEIFGVNGHIRDVTDGFAREGYRAIAPALFDRIERGFDAGYSAPEMQRGMGMAGRLEPAQIVADTAAAIAALGLERVGIVGYCLGGNVAFRAANALPVLCAVAYYGGIHRLIDLAPKCPVLGHFGASDTHIPIAEVMAVAQRYPEQVTLHVYEAGHGFNCDQRSSYDAKSAELARERTLAFFRQHLG